MLPAPSQTLMTPPRSCARGGYKVQRSTSHVSLDPFAHPGGAAIAQGTTVAVRNRFDGAWCNGFTVADVIVGSGGTLIGYLISRASDPSCVLPETIPVEDIIPVRAHD